MCVEKCGDYYCDAHLLARTHTRRHYFIVKDSMDQYEYIQICLCDVRMCYMYSLVFSVLQNDMYQYHIVVMLVMLALPLPLLFPLLYRNIIYQKKTHRTHRNKCH